MNVYIDFGRKFLVCKLLHREIVFLKVENPIDVFLENVKKACRGLRGWEIETYSSARHAPVAARLA